MFSPDDPGMDETPDVEIDATTYDAAASGLGAPPGVAVKNPPYTPPSVYVYPWNSGSYLYIVPGNSLWAAFSGLNSGVNRVHKGG